MHPLFASLHLGCNLKMALRSRLTNLGQLINDVRPNKSCLGLYSTAKVTVPFADGAFNGVRVPSHYDHFQALTVAEMLTINFATT